MTKTNEVLRIKWSETESMSAIIYKSKRALPLYPMCIEKSDCYILASWCGYYTFPKDGSPVTLFDGVVNKQRPDITFEVAPLED